MNMIKRWFGKTEETNKKEKTIWIDVSKQIREEAEYQRREEESRKCEEASRLREVLCEQFDQVAKEYGFHEGFKWWFFSYFEANMVKDEVRWFQLNPRYFVKISDLERDGYIIKEPVLKWSDLIPLAERHSEFQKEIEERPYTKYVRL